jgi:sphingolipid delta-4 desaturase
MNIKEHDPDLPSEWEIRTMNTPFRKFLFIFFQSFFYGLRPLILMPKKPTLYEAINLVAVFTVDYIVYVRMGGFALLWIVLGALIGIG